MPLTVEDRSSCISHPAGEPLLVIRQWQLEFCDSNPCAAALLSFLEYWHNHRLNAAPRFEPEQQPDGEALLQWHTEADLKKGILGLYDHKAIRKGLELLVRKGAIEIRRNPTPRFKCDRTRYFLFKPEALNQFITEKTSARHFCSSRGR